MPPPTISFATPVLLAVAACAAALAVAVWVRRGAEAPRAAALSALAGLIALALAAGTPDASWPRPGRVAVLIDVSPSTRTAHFRDPARFVQRIGQLLGDRPYQLYRFASSTTPCAPGDVAIEQEAERTVFAPPAADAIVAFTDARFALPDDSPPVYVVVDESLEQPADAQVRSIDWRPQDVAAGVANAGPQPRELVWTGVAGNLTAVVPGGASLVATAPAADATTITARFEPGDAWPQNDALTILAPPPAQTQRWWIGSGPPDGSWLAMSPQSLPLDAAAYLAAGVIVVAGEPADQFTAAQLDRLHSYVTALGGGLLITGGPRAFAAGGYENTPLDALSPLASRPPTPTTHWIVLVDASGSMAGESGGVTRWTRAGEALRSILSSLPAADPVSVGGFGRQVTWWSTQRSVRETLDVTLPPPQVEPHGPTNLEPALRDLAAAADKDLPTRTIVLTDAQASLDDPAALAASLRAARVSLHVLTLVPTPPEHPLGLLARDTGGQMDSEPDPQRWAAAARRLAGAAAGDLVQTQAASVTFAGELSGLPPRTLPRWNRVWQRDGATPLAAADAAPLAAWWNRGGGRVAALAFEPTAAEIAAAADLVAQPPRDPRLSVRWQTSPRLALTLDAADGSSFINDLAVWLDVVSPDGNQSRTTRLPQTAPGRYAVQIDPPRRPALAVVRVGERMVDRHALAGRYAPEFDAVGNDRAAMAMLAERTGGQVIEPGDAGPIDFRWPPRRVGLTSPLAVLGGALILLALAIWRRS